MNKTLKNAIDNAIKSYQQGREKLHAVACQCVEHALKHGDITPMHYLLEQMGARSQTRHRIAAWVRHHGRFEEEGKSKYFITANVTSDGQIKCKVAEKAVREGFTVQPFEQGPYWEVLDVQKTKTAFELEKALIQLVKKAEKEGSTESDIKQALDKAFKIVNAA